MLRKCAQTILQETAKPGEKLEVDLLLGSKQGSADPDAADGLAGDLPGFRRWFIA
jgi:hypothetical protein